MFKNMIIKMRAGENFPIKIPEELHAKLRTFNTFSHLPILTLLDILDVCSIELREGRITPKQFESVIYFLLKTNKRIFKRKSVQQQFERIMCKKESLLLINLNIYCRK